MSKESLIRGRRLALICLALSGLAPPLLAPSSTASAQGAPKAAVAYPGRSAASLPAREHFVYARSVGDVAGKLDIELARKSSGGKSWYELVSHAPDEDALYTLDATSLALIRSDVTTRTATTTIRRLTEVVEDRLVLDPDELQISATEPFQQRIRLIPFEEKPVYRLIFQGSQSVPGFSLILSVLGRETVAVEGRTWDCWKVEVGAKGVVGSFFGKSHYWYQAEWPHALVKFEGPSSYPGSPMTRLELLSYSSS